MLREEAADLQIPTSTAALLFRRRFRSPFSWFEMLMIDTRKWQCNASTHDVAGRQAMPLVLKEASWTSDIVSGSITLPLPTVYHEHFENGDRNRRRNINAAIEVGISRSAASSLNIHSHGLFS